MFREIFYVLYFKNHLSKHYYQLNQLTICLDKNVSLEVLNLLNLLSRKYPFLKLRQSEAQTINIDLEQNHLLNLNLNASKILHSDTCLLIGINPRYEGYQLNLTLRLRYLKGNFKIIQINSLSNLTIATHSISNNSKNLKSLMEGNNLFCQELVSASSPIFISNTEIFKRKDSFGVTNSLKLLLSHINTYSFTKTSEQFNVLNSSFNESGFNHFNILKTMQNLDLKNSQGVYFLSNSLNAYNIKKILNLKLLNFFQNTAVTNKLLITQNKALESVKTAIFKKNFGCSNQIHLPNSIFFETSGTYINTTGNINKVVKVITPLTHIKSDWQIIRKFFSYCKKTFFVSNVFENNKLIFNNNKFKNYSMFQHYAISNLNNFSFQGFKKIKTPNIKCLRFRPKRNVFANSQFKLWLNDFYLDSKVYNTKYSSTMIQCSKFSRLEHTNFKF